MCKYGSELVDAFVPVAAVKVTLGPMTVTASAGVASTKVKMNATLMDNHFFMLLLPFV